MIHTTHLMAVMAAAPTAGPARADTAAAVRRRSWRSDHSTSLSPMSAAGRPRNSLRSDGSETEKRKVLRLALRSLRSTALAQDDRMKGAAAPAGRRGLQITA